MALCALVQSPAAAQAGPDSRPNAREVVTRADQLPRRNYRLDKLPSAYMQEPLIALRALGAKIEGDLLADLSRYEIRDPTALSEMYGSLATLAQVRGDWAAVPGWTAKARALQSKPALRFTSGVITDLLAEQQQEKRGVDWLTAQVQERFSAMPWNDVQDAVKTARGRIENYNTQLVVGTFKSQLDVAAQNGGMEVPGTVAITLIGARLQADLLAPNKQAIVNGLSTVIDANRQAEAAPDIWTPRTFSIAADAKASPVTIAVWDSGVDLALFKTSAVRGMAFDASFAPAKDLLRALGDAQDRWPELRGLIKGAMDQRAALDTEDAKHFKAVLASLKSDDVNAFTEDIALASLYSHGTHVAGIAVEGNPFARVYAGTMLWNHKNIPDKPSEAHSRATADAYTAMVKGFQAAGVRVVNMSWRYGPSDIEGMMTYHNLGGSPEARKKEAQRLFRIESDALKAAIINAPEIFFVAGAGNEDNSADFQDYIPAGLELPNLITVGAADTAGRETSFSTFGKTVVVHANGFEVESYVPGGVKLRLSGTSMASPQVANLAGKLLALKPSLTPVQVKSVILQGAERVPLADGKAGRVVLINPRKTAALAGVSL